VLAGRASNDETTMVLHKTGGDVRESYGKIEICKILLAFVRWPKVGIGQFFYATAS
jgi:hypothetical protein